MFGIGLPEMIVILAVALVVVGPDKLPEMARSLAKGVVELKRTMHQLKNSLTEEGELDSVKAELQETGKDLKDQLVDQDFQVWRPDEELKKKLIEVEPDKVRPWEAERKQEVPGEEKGDQEEKGEKKDNPDSITAADATQEEQPEQKDQATGSEK